MIATVVVWVVAGLLSLWSAAQIALLWRDRRRPVKGADGVWRAPRPYHNGWGER